MSLTLRSSAFDPGGHIPAAHTCDGGDTAPHLFWSGAPAGTRSFAIIMDDPDAPHGVFTHWVLFDIPSDRTDIPSGTRADAIGVSGRNSAGRAAYMGPCPPSGTHRYVFHLFALDVETLTLTAGVKRDVVERALASHTIAKTELVGRYGRRR